MSMVLSVIGWGCLAILGLLALGYALYALAQFLTILPALLALMWLLFFIGLPFYLVHQYDSWAWLGLVLLSWPLAYVPLYLEDLYDKHQAKMGS